ncbi:MAG: long-chain acyl-CoA synthetase [Solirubrobacterales bacterium]|jgi:long-chain acyl-CoA synthetase|nr:long-chain acyl-CoA synthetase [Solirubrobacterales bacterium]
METATVEAAPVGQDRGVRSKTIADLLPGAISAYGPRAAVKFKDGSGNWVDQSYGDLGDVVRRLSLGLIDLGINRGDRVAILANTRVEWTWFDFAALTAGATVVPIYQTNSPEECQYVLENSDSVAVIVEDEEQLEKVRAIRGSCPKLEHVILMTGSAQDAISLEELGARSAGHTDSEWEERYAAIEPGDICTFIYTSGTTGPPKGCVISHGNYRSMLDMVLDAGTLGEDELTYLYLPLAHSFALLIQFGTFALGATLAYWERDPLKIVPNLEEVKPTYFPSVPRIFEKIYTTATAAVAKEGGLKKAVFDWAVRTGAKVRELERAGKQPGFLLKREYEIADKQVLSKIRDLFGGRLTLAVTGAAPINPEILRFFDAAGVLVLEGWGMTETSTAATIATPESFKFGTVGRPFPGVELKIADDGEILVKGPNIFQGYYKNAEATADTLVDGWLHTGDIGEVDADGFLKITGRKKDIIITAGGKNITPANLEAEIKQSPLVSQCVVIGDRRPFLVALVTLDAEEAEKFATERGEPTDAESLASSAAIREAVEGHVEKINEKFARVEQVKKIKILPHDLSQEGGELTPTLKVKRNVVADKYAGDIESLYSG